MSMQKVLLIGPSPYRSKGGMATVIREMVENKSIIGYDIDYFESYIDTNKIYKYLFTIFSFIKFLFIYKKYDLFHVHVAGYGSTFRKKIYIDFLKKKNKKVILHLHSAEYIKFYQSLSANKKNKVKQMFNEVDTILVLSKYWEKNIINFFNVTNVIILNNGVNFKILSNGSTNDISANKKFIVLGRVGQRKGSYDLLKACKNLKEDNYDFELFICGDGETKKAQDIVNSYNLTSDVHIVGWVDLTEKIRYLRRASTLILPSYNEGLPVAILEAMAAGKIIVSTVVGGIPEIVGKDNGILFEPGDVKTLTIILKNILDNKYNINNFKEKNMLKIKESYDLEVIYRKLFKIYKEVLNK